MRIVLTYSKNQNWHNLIENIMKDALAKYFMEKE